MSIEISAYWIPIFFTVAPIFCAIFLVDSGHGIGAGISNVLALVPALFISMLSWIIYAVLK